MEKRLDQTEEHVPKEPFSHEIHADYQKLLNDLKNDFFTKYNEEQHVSTDYDEFIIFGNIGRGEITSMFLVRHRDQRNKYFAAKRLFKTKIIESNRLRQVFIQKQVLYSVNFPFIINLKYTFKDISSIYFVYPYMPGGDLHAYLIKYKNLKERDAMFYSAQILLAIEYLHNLGLVYRNLKPENIYLDSNGYIKIADFRFCKFLKNYRTYTLCGTPEYLAPEMILMKGYGKGVDWWIFGIVLYEMIAGYTPFFAADPMKVAEKIIAGKIKFNENFTPKARNLIKNILQTDISKRYGTLKNGVADIKYHEWYQIIDWQALFNRKIVAPYIPDPVYDNIEQDYAAHNYSDDQNCSEATRKEFEFF